MDERFYLGLANELLAKFRRVSSFVSHGSSIGTYHEEALRTVLRLMLPDRFSLRTGFVFHPDNGASQQGDILIVDEMEAGAYFFREGNFAVVDQAALVCVIEVKASLDKSSFKEALEGLASFQRVTAKPYPVTALFAFHGASFTPARLDDWYKSIKIPDEIPYYPWSIYALNRGLISLRYPSSSEWGHYVPVGEAKLGPKIKSLSLFLQTIRKAVLSRAGSMDNPSPRPGLTAFPGPPSFFGLAQECARAPTNDPLVGQRRLIFGPS